MVAHRLAGGLQALVALVRPGPEPTEGEGFSCEQPATNACCPGLGSQEGGTKARARMRPRTWSRVW